MQTHAVKCTDKNSIAARMCWGLVMRPTVRKVRSLKPKAASRHMLKKIKFRDMKSLSVLLPFLEGKIILLGSISKQSRFKSNRSYSLSRKNGFNILLRRVPKTWL